MADPDFQCRHRYARRPLKIEEGELVFPMPDKYLRTRHEYALTVSFIAHRRSFGLAYWLLQPDYFDCMPQDSGVYIRPIVRTASLVPGAAYPGDIDLLIIPYEGDELILHRVIAMEIKVLRGSFARQGKAPNQLGVSQAMALLSLGFPYVALAHLIVSDESPADAWRDIGTARVIDSEGTVELLPSQRVDWLPIDLTFRTFGRLMTACAGYPELGLLSHYLGSSDEDIIGGESISAVWHPQARRASPNPQPSRDLVASVAALFDRNPGSFLQTTRY